MTSLDAPATDPENRLPDHDAALGELLCELAHRDYAFVTPTPASHARVLARSPGRTARNLRDIFGWSLPFAPALLDAPLLKALLASDALEQLEGGLLRSRYRVSRLDDALFLHATYPTQDKDAVFFGPDSYRFADLIRAELADCPRHRGARLVDIGTGTGVGGIVAARQCPVLRVTMTDINPTALRLARINAQVAGIEAEFVHGPNLDPVAGDIDIILANPPYIVDAEGRDYRDGGDMHGTRAAYDMAVAAVQRLAPGGRFILYTGSPIIGGEDRLAHALADLAARAGHQLRYREIDPDVFGEELGNPAYADVDRIAVVGAVIARPA